MLTALLPVEAAPASPGSTARPVHWASLLQALLSFLAALGLWGAALVVGVVAIRQVQESPSNATAALPSTLMAAGLFLCGLLLLPSGGYALARLLGKFLPPLAQAIPFLRPTLLIWALPPVIIAGHWLSAMTAVTWLLLPFLHVLAIGLPVLWLTHLATRRLPFGSPQRLWGVFGSGLILGPLIILITEAILLVGIVFLAAVWLASQPELSAQILHLAQTLRSDPPTSEALLELLEPLLTRPEVIVGIFAFGALLVPLLEELLKPIGVWLLARSRLTPVAGFTAGVLSGAGYALFESLALTSNAMDWTPLVLVRAGTAVIHIATTGLTGWALVSAWRQGSYFQLAGAYLLATAIHALWNGLTLAAVIAEITAQAPVTAVHRTAFDLSAATPAGLLTLTGGAFVMLILANRRLRQPSPALAAGEVIKNT
ncbi:MAG: PrsW family glutamic-type intramembrane protease [Anaerolineales bacterium]|nr:PrsW family glutamic-type intramembrane protease [Anaerolineales bacterium]